MRRREDLPMQKVTLFMYEGDMDFLRDLYPRLGASKMVRRLVRHFRTQIESGAKSESMNMSINDVELPS